MDIKLKNKLNGNRQNGHLLGVLLIFVVIMATAATAVALYPYIRRRAMQYGGESEGAYQAEAADNMSIQVMNGTYTLWMDYAQQKAGHLLTPAQVFVPGLKEKIDAANQQKWDWEQMAGQGLEAAVDADGSRLNGAAAGVDADGIGLEESVADADGAGREEPAAGTDGTSPVAAADGTVPAESVASEDGTSPTRPALAADAVGGGIRREHAETAPEEYYLDIQNFMDGKGYSWQENFRRMASQMDYQLLDKDGVVVLENRQHNEYTVHVEMVYDSFGNMAVTYNNNSDPLSKKLSSSLNYYRDHNPLRQKLGVDYLYSGVEFYGPRDVVYNFWLPEALLGQADPLSEVSVDMEMIWYSGSLLLIIMATTLVVAMFAMLLPCVKRFGLGQGVITRVPFEIVSLAVLAGFAALVAWGLLIQLVEYTLNGWLAAEIQQMGFDNAAAQAFAYAFNIFVWMCALGGVYWSVTCYRAIFSLGPKRYLKERTLIGMCCCWLARLCVRFFRSLGRVDFREKQNRVIGKLVAGNFLLLAVVCSLWFITAAAAESMSMGVAGGIGWLAVYSVALFFLLRKYWRKLQLHYGRLLKAFRQVAAGNLNAQIEGELGMFEPFRGELGTIQEGLKQAVEKEVKSQRMKTELVTNVSHDLKTPLTAIITYVNLLKEEHLSEADRTSYIDVLEQKSMRLKVLIEDLFEVSKANSNNITLHLEPVDVVNLLKQVRHELSDKLTESNLDFRWNLPDGKVILNLDGPKTSRIFENLLLNIAKYAMPGTRAYIDMEDMPEHAVITMRNISAMELTIKGQDLTERFVRGDASRNTEGSGLGLAIAKSFTEVQGGTLAAETEADLFRVVLSWPKK